MKILFAASEAAPFVKTGGLGDVMSALPKELAKIQGNEVAVILPYYSSFKFDTKYETEFITAFSVALAWRNTYCGLFRYKKKNAGKTDATYYFLDNEYYFSRNSCYGDMDDGERFAFFSKALLEVLQYINFYPDIIHCNDWQTGFVPLFYKAFYSNIPKYEKIKTVFTIHNIEYQGKADDNFICEVLGVPQHLMNAARFDGCVNAMKCAIVLCDRLTTVSPTYSHEIRYAYFAKGLENIINENSYKLTGILNGVDTRLFNPKTDKCLFKLYSHGDIEAKTENKLMLQQQLGLEENASIPLFAIVSRLAAHKGIELVRTVMENLVQMNIQLVVLGTGDKEFEDCFKYYDYAYPRKVAAKICFDGTLANRIYAGADFFLMPSKSEPCGLAQIIAMRYGAIPIVRETGGLFDTVTPIDMQSMTGRGFTFKTYNAYDMLDAVKRAEKFFYKEDERRKIVDGIMRADLGWKKSAVQYQQLYMDMVND